MPSSLGEGFDAPFGDASWGLADAKVCVYGLNSVGSSRMGPAHVVGESAGEEAGEPKSFGVFVCSVANAEGLWNEVISRSSSELPTVDDVLFVRLVL